MKPVIGIPSALIYHFYHYSLHTFFQKLGCHVVYSSYSNKVMLDNGTKMTMLDNCLPLKLYFGHIQTLEKEVDYLFIPRLVSLKKREYMCPKFIGIPDLIAKTFPNTEEKILSPEINFNKKKNFWNAANYIGNMLKIPTTTLANSFLSAAYIYRKTMKQHKKQLFNFNHDNKHNPRIGVLGHEYVLNDKLVGMPIIQKLQKLGCNVITSANLTWINRNKTDKLIPKQLYWTKNKTLFEAALYISEHGLVDGIIQINTFPCGPDSVISELIERKIFRIHSIPLMTLTLDEHTGLSGIQTRLEAFIDLLNRRGFSENYFSSHG